jgi:hypothetical protein
MTTEVLTNIVDRTNSMLDLGSSANNKTTNPYIQEMLSEGIMPAISFLYHKCPGSEFMEKANLFRSAIVVGSNGLQSPPEFGGADQFGFPLDKTNIRRIVQNYDDGDVRFIESAMNSILL